MRCYSVFVEYIYDHTLQCAFSAVRFSLTLLVSSQLSAHLKEGWTPLVEMSQAFSNS